MILADHATFATSTAGYLTGVGTPVLAILIGAMWKSWSGRLARQDAALIEQSKALAILLADHNHMAEEVKANTTKINALDRTTAVLASKVNDHERWHERKGD